MSINLYLLRHAQSADKQIGQSDHDRELTPLGLKQAMLIGSFLQQQKISLDIIMSSTAERAKATATTLCDAMKFEEERILLRDELYEASTRTFLEFITQLDDNLINVMCIGHNPVISYLAEYLTKAEIGSMVTGGLVVIQFNINTWKEVHEGAGKLIHNINPESVIYTH